MADSNRPIPDEALADDLMTLRDAAARRADVQFNQTETVPTDDNVASNLTTVHQGDLRSDDDNAFQTGAAGTDNESDDDAPNNEGDEFNALPDPDTVGDPETTVGSESRGETESGPAVPSANEPRGAASRAQSSDNQAASAGGREGNLDAPSATQGQTWACG